MWTHRQAIRAWARMRSLRLSDVLSNGAIKVNVFHAGQLGPIPEQIRNVLAGTQDMHLLFPEFLTNLIDESKVISAPYLFKSHAHQQAFFRSEIFKPALDKLRNLGGRRDRRGLDLVADGPARSDLGAPGQDAG